MVQWWEKLCVGVPVVWQCRRCRESERNVAVDAGFGVRIEGGVEILAEMGFGISTAFAQELQKCGDGEVVA